MSHYLRSISSGLRRWHSSLLRMVERRVLLISSTKLMSRWMQLPPKLVQWVVTEQKRAQVVIMAAKNQRPQLLVVIQISIECFLQKLFRSVMRMVLPLNLFVNKQLSKRCLNWMTYLPYSISSRHHSTPMTLMYTKVVQLVAHKMEIRWAKPKVKGSHTRNLFSLPFWVKITWSS